jgi:predicted Zn finger-like uncharacterized protein
MITHCPSCQTHFRVHAEQLAARAGQVRCGKCSRVFNALEYLTEESAPAHEPTVAQAHTLVRAVAPAPEPAPEPVSEPGTEYASEPAPAESVSTQEAVASAEALQPAIAISANVEVEAPQVAAETSEALMPELAPAQPDSVAPAGAEGAIAYDFGPIAAADPAKRVRRWPWILGAFLLLLVLLAQAAYFYRSALVVVFPEIKPYAAELCASLGCEVPLMRRIEQLSIEASDLQADSANPSIMVLSATLKNRAVFEQQLPLLELTLTDTQDQPVVRRVLTAQDYLGKAADTQAGFAPNSEIAIKVFIEGSKVKASGYRLYLFYP